jgi:hypothetical protein
VLGRLAADDRPAPSVAVAAPNRSKLRPSLGVSLRSSPNVAPLRRLRVGRADRLVPVMSLNAVTIATSSDSAT